MFSKTTTRVKSVLLILVAAMSVQIAWLMFGSTQNFGHDAAGRLVSADYGASTTISYVYDNAGNLRLLSSPGPGLVIGAVAGNQFTLSWPAAPSGYVLETSPSVGSGAVWSTNGLPSPTLIGNFLTVTLPLSGSAQFYRLRKP